jgi:phosphate/sulfate permease
VDLGLAVAILLAATFATTNGLHDASNAIATLVATRAATSLQGILLASVFNLLEGDAIAPAQAAIRAERRVGGRLLPRHGKPSRGHGHARADRPP